MWVGSNVTWVIAKVWTVIKDKYWISVLYSIWHYGRKDNPGFSSEKMYYNGDSISGKQIYAGKENRCFKTNFKILNCTKLGF